MAVDALAVLQIRWPPREIFDAPEVRWPAVEFFGVPLMWYEHMYIGIQILQAAREGG